MAEGNYLQICFRRRLIETHPEFLISAIFHRLPPAGNPKGKEDKALKIWSVILFFSLICSELAASSLEVFPEQTIVQPYREVLNKSGCKFMSSDSFDITPVSKASLKNIPGDILFIRRLQNKNNRSEKIIPSVVFTPACFDEAEGASGYIAKDSFVYQLIFQIIQTVFAIPGLVDHGRDFDFIRKLMNQLSQTDYLELFYSLPGVTSDPVVLYRNHRVEIPGLIKQGALWFPKLTGEEMLPDRRLIMPLSAGVISMLDAIVRAVNLKTTDQAWTPDLQCSGETGTVCQYLPESQRNMITVNRKILLMQDASVIIPLADIDNMSALHLDQSGQLALVNLQWMPEQLDMVYLYYFPCEECSRRFDALVRRRYSSTMNFARFLGMFSHRNVPGHPVPALADQIVQGGQGPGGPDDFPMFSDSGHDLIFPGNIPSGRQATGAKKRKKRKSADAGKTGEGGQKVEQQPSASESPKRVSFWDDDDEEKDPDKRREHAEQEKQSLKDKVRAGYKKIHTATKKLIKDMDDELGYLVDRLKNKNTDTASSIAKDNKTRLKRWRFVVKTEPGGNKNKVLSGRIKDKALLNLKLQQEAVEEDYVIEPETGTVLANGKRRVSVIAPEDIEQIRSYQSSLVTEDDSEVQVFEIEHQFDSETPALMAFGQRRASSVAHVHVEALRGRLNSLLEGEKDIREMSRKEIAAASEKINQLLDDELTLRYEELDRLDQGRTRLAGEIIRKKEELDQLYGAWFGGSNKDAAQVEADLTNLQLKAQKVCEKYAAMHAYGARYRHWAGSLIRKEFDDSAYERLKELNSAQERVLGSFKVAYFGRHWNNLALPDAAHPPLVAKRKFFPGAPGAQSFIGIYGNRIVVALTSVLASLGGGYYLSDSVYDIYRRFIEGDVSAVNSPGPDSEDKDEEAIPADPNVF